jgi:hypothetical protein
VSLVAQGGGEVLHAGAACTLGRVGAVGLVHNLDSSGR